MDYFWGILGFLVIGGPILIVVYDAIKAMCNSIKQLWINREEIMEKVVTFIGGIFIFISFALLLYLLLFKGCDSSGFNSDHIHYHRF